MSEGMMTYRNFFDSSYHYGSMMSRLIDSTTKLNLGNNRITDRVGMDKILGALKGYQDRDLEVILVYDPLVGMLQKDFLGAHFIKGKFLDISEHAITFQGPDGMAHGGLKTPGSPYIITPNNMIDVFITPSNTIDVFAVRSYDQILPKDQSGWEEKSGWTVYEFSIVHGPKIGEIRANTSLEGFMELIASTKSMQIESAKGYTTPVRLDNIFFKERNTEEKSQNKYRKVPSTERFDIKVAHSEFSKNIKVEGHRNRK